MFLLSRHKKGRRPQEGFLNKLCCLKFEKWWKKCKMLIRNWKRWWVCLLVKYASSSFIIFSDRPPFLFYCLPLGEGGYSGSLTCCTLLCSWVSPDSRQLCSTWLLLFQALEMRIFVSCTSFEIKTIPLFGINTILGCLKKVVTFPMC